jgi:hypothetical protein
MRAAVSMCKLKAVGVITCNCIHKYGCTHCELMADVTIAPFAHLGSSINHMKDPPTGELAQ